MKTIWHNTKQVVISYLRRLEHNGTLDGFLGYVRTTGDAQVAELFEVAKPEDFSKLLKKNDVFSTVFECYKEWSSDYVERGIGHKPCVPS